MNWLLHNVRSLGVLVGFALACTHASGTGSAPDGAAAAADANGAADGATTDGPQGDAATAADLIASHTETGLPSAEAGALDCEGAFAAALEKDCTTANDCALVAHNDCCGTTKIAVKAGTEASVGPAERAYVACVPGCNQRGCFHADRAEVGGTPGTGQTIVATCMAGRCTSVVATGSNSCATNSDCGPGRLCVASVTNLGPSSTSRSACQPNPCATPQPTCACAASLCAPATPMCEVQIDRLVCTDGRR